MNRKLLFGIVVASWFLFLQSAVAVTPATDSLKAKSKPPVPFGSVMKTIKPSPKIADFEGKTPLLQMGWIGVTDTVIGGKSTATISIAPDGAAGTKQSLKITGSTAMGSNPFAIFAGAATRFDGGSSIYDVTGYAGIKFWAKGDSNTYRIELPCAAVTDFMNHSFSFTPPAGQWKEFKIPFVGFKQMPYGKKVPWTGTDVQGIQFFTASGVVPKFTLQIDEIELYK
jgi:hypothetical protein